MKFAIKTDEQTVQIALEQAAETVTARANGLSAVTFDADDPTKPRLVVSRDALDALGIALVIDGPAPDVVG